MILSAEILLANLHLVPVGALIATIASFLGIGGGLLWAPYLILVRGLDPQTAIMLSLLIQIAGMGSATLQNIRNRSIFWKLLIRLIPFLVAGALLGSYVAQGLPSGWFLKMGLGILSIVISLYFAFKTERYGIDLNLDRSTRPTLPVMAMSGFFGALSGLFSIGVSDFLIPLMRSRLKIPMANAIGTSIFINFSIAAISGLFHASLAGGRFNDDTVGLLLCAWTGAFLGGQLGPRLSAMIEDERLKEIFIFALLLLGIHMIYQSI
ncbi:MAG: sulfite exporter TauE/SafE family protein [Spirochaetes bacterium]|nr:sulfite exporter TauE/SafE family protein [Spirochaetota bacterium]